MRRRITVHRVSCLKPFALDKNSRIPAKPHPDVAQVLEQNAAFDSLQWFQTVGREQDSEIQAVLESHGASGDRRQGRTSTGFVTWALEGFSVSGFSRSSPVAEAPSEDSLPENTKLLLNRNRSQQAEFKLLQHTLSAARMLVDTDWH